MTETTTIEICKLIVSVFMAIKNALLSIKFLVFCLIIGAISAFVPLSWWKWVKMPVVGKFCQVHHEFTILIFSLVLIVVSILYVGGIWHRHKEELRFSGLMESLTPVEMKAVCNAYYNGGKYSLPSCYAEIESLKKKELIMVSHKSDFLGEQEFVLPRKTHDYIGSHTDFFEKRGVKPDSPDNDKFTYGGMI